MYTIIDSSTVVSREKLSLTACISYLFSLHIGGCFGKVFRFSFSEYLDLAAAIRLFWTGHLETISNA